MEQNIAGGVTPVFAMDNVSFFYPQQQRPALKNLNLSIQEGEFFLLCGPSGCGKSTLLRQLKSVLAPSGRGEGEIFFQGKPLRQWDFAHQSEKIGFVQQSPDNQVVTDKVWHELAFGLESLGYDTPTIRRRVAEMASFFGIQTWFYQNVAELSGGQKQLLNLASIMVMQPSVLILDEPTSQLDPIAASEFLSVLGKINRELGTTIIVTEHRMEEVFPMASRVAVMDRGELIAVGSPREVGGLLKDWGHGMFLAMPTAVRVWSGVHSQQACPITVGEGRQWLTKFAQDHPLRPVPRRGSGEENDEVVLSAKELWFRYEREGQDVVKGLDLQVRRGEFVAIMGGNATGKSTTLKLLTGLYRGYRGEVEVTGRLALLPQNPQTLFVKKTVEEDLRELLLHGKLEGDLVRQKVADIAALCRLDELLERHPYDLSGGEQQRVALAKMLLLEPEIFLLDEPTKGLDGEFKEIFGQILTALIHQGTTILMVSHDVEFCAKYAHRCGLFFDGGLVTQGDPQTFFSGNSFYTTGANRMGRGLCEGGITPEDLIFACGGEMPPTPQRRGEDNPPPPVGEMVSTQGSEVALGLPRRTMVAAVMILFLIPLTLFVGIHYLDGRKYYFIALLILLQCMAPFFLLFEGRKPQARELVMVAVLCAIGVASRVAFFMIPQFKPVVALSIIAGVALGGETGFLVGAMSMLASNLFFAQGPWTPWQMFAMGIIGFLAGVLFRKGMLRPAKLSLALFGLLSSVLVYGGIMNTAAALMWTNELNWGILATYYISGFPMDLIQGVATALFLWCGAQPMLEKLERLKVKYGLL